MSGPGSMRWGAKRKDAIGRLSHFLLLSLSGFCLTTSCGVLGQEDLDYQKRGNRYEGIKPKPVSGFDIELLSARIDYRDNTDSVGERFQVRFYLEHPAPAHLVVRELDNEHYYWLDKVEPKSPWQPGFANVFDWPTADVIRQLDGLKLYDLGVVVRLDEPEPGAIEHVAPVMLYQSQQPTEVKGYVFTFRLRDEANVKGTVYNESSGKPLFVQDLGRQRGGRPFTVRWGLTATPARAGAYKLVLAGYVLGTNDPVSQVVHFYHQPEIK
ncbi:MAG: hypothetical protein ACREVK_00995 [Gammaproteobacteria bacterium]